jgi:hypothetical protein
MSDFMKKPCKDCPYRRDVKPFLTPERGEELAYHATNPYNSFPCHKTTEASEDDEGSEMMVTEESKECAGFLTLMANEAGRTPYDHDGFEPSYDLCYDGAYEMVEAYEEQ